MKSFSAKDIFYISFIITLLFYIYMNNKINNDFLGIDERDKQIEQLEQQNSKYLNDVFEQKKKIQEISKKVDSLESLKPKIIQRTKYINNEIDKANCAQLIARFDSIFTSASIK
jgi:peptidoglycan hydrolase CwlO-like protein